MSQHYLAFPVSERFGGALAGYMALHSKIRHSVGSAVAFPKHLADSGNNQRYLGRDVEGNKGLVGLFKTAFPGSDLLYYRAYL